MALIKFLGFMLLFLVNFLASTAHACVDFAGTYNTAESWYDVSLIDNGKKYCWGRGPASKSSPLPSPLAFPRSSAWDGIKTWLTGLLSQLGRTSSGSPRRRWASTASKAAACG
jgi:hypothetical protein